MTNQVEGITKVELEKMVPEVRELEAKGVGAVILLTMLIACCKPITIEPPTQPEEPLPEFLKPQAG